MQLIMQNLLLTFTPQNYCVTLCTFAIENCPLLRALFLQFFSQLPKLIHKAQVALSFYVAGMSSLFQITNQMTFIGWVIGRVPLHSKKITHFKINTFFISFSLVTSKSRSVLNLPLGCF